MGVTDYFDGYLARSSGAVSKLGQFLDPIADKLMIAAVIVVLTAQGYLRGPYVGDLHVVAGLIILIREIAVSGLREFLGGLQVSMPVSRLAKWKTTLQLMAFGGLILGGAVHGPPCQSLADDCRTLAQGWIHVASLACLWAGSSADRHHWLGLSAGGPETHGLSASARGGSADQRNAEPVARIVAIEILFAGEVAQRFHQLGMDRDLKGDSCVVVDPPGYPSGNLSIGLQAQLDPVAFLQAGIAHFDHAATARQIVESDHFRRAIIGYATDFQVRAETTVRTHNFQSCPG